MASYDFEQARKEGRSTSLEELLNITVAGGDGVQESPEFTIYVQEIMDTGVRISVRSLHSEIIDFIVQGNELFRI